MSQLAQYETKETQMGRGHQQSIRLSPDQYAAVSEIACAENRTVSNTIRVLLQEALNSRQA